MCLHQTGDDAGLYPLVGARLASVPLLGLLVVARREDLRGALPRPRGRRRRRERRARHGRQRPVPVALRHGLLAVVSAITGLYPAATVILAQTVLSERMRRTQVGGLAIAGVAATLIALA